MSHSGDESGEENSSAYFEPIVSRPLIDVKTLEEDEACLFRARAKLFRFDAKSNEPEWKERGTGELKILRNFTTPHCRIIMRRDKTLKACTFFIRDSYICANHYILSCMELQPVTGSNRGFIWKAPNDFADKEIKAEILGVRFANAEIALEFKKVFNNCKQSLYGLSDQPAKCSDSAVVEPVRATDKKTYSTAPGCESKAAADQLTDRLSKIQLQSTMENQSVDVAAH
ncbi:unnamed protein product [Hydatigera taeniaeformis]|uniref:Ran-specific GTPase-activating protein n=1 Tax=Hydatigena taeniaeformis TaxID=6205 RepID=A0A0R3X2H6_HYDTA|nr:unnamed protein product [Hydatigera taeniaeformis]